MNPRALNVKVKKPHTLIVSFDNGELKEFNLSPYLSYPVYEKLQDEVYFMKAHVKSGIVVWDDETDLDPDTLYLESQTLILA